MADAYELLKQAKYNELQKKKNMDLASLDTQENSLNNQYQDLYSAINSKRAQAQQTYQQNRDNEAVSNAQRLQQVRDYMAKNNLLQSGENVDALLRSNTDYSNAMSSIKNNENNYYSDLDNQDLSAQRDRAAKIADILNQRKLVEQGFNSDVQSVYDQLDAQKLQAAQQAANRSSSGGSSTASDSAIIKAQQEQDKRDIWSEFLGLRTPDERRQFLAQMRYKIIGAVGPEEYTKLTNSLNADLSSSNSVPAYLSGGI